MNLDKQLEALEKQFVPGMTINVTPLPDTKVVIHADSYESAKQVIEALMPVEEEDQTREGYWADYIWAMHTQLFTVGLHHAPDLLGVLVDLLTDDLAILAHSAENLRSEAEYARLDERAKRAALSAGRKYVERLEAEFV